MRYSSDEDAKHMCYDLDSLNVAAAIFGFVPLVVDGHPLKREHFIPLDINDMFYKYYVKEKDGCYLIDIYGRGRMPSEVHMKILEALKLKGNLK